MARYKPLTQTTVILSRHCFCYDREKPLKGFLQPRQPLLSAQQSLWLEVFSGGPVCLCVEFTEAPMEKHSTTAELHSSTIDTIERMNNGFIF